MEYPTLFTAGTRWLAPRQSNDPEYVVIHEAGHQFWYGMVANNETEHAWLDEGLNEYADSRLPVGGVPARITWCSGSSATSSRGSTATSR